MLSTAYRAKKLLRTIRPEVELGSKTKDVLAQVPKQ